MSISCRLKEESLRDIIGTARRIVKRLSSRRHAAASDGYRRLGAPLIHDLADELEIQRDLT
jgi:hypothetical protein